ncbi:MAG: hypothetical protein JNM85_10100 [Chthonomonas sp.]|nr:hypothetical protein [Chthonomonas sp.]
MKIKVILFAVAIVGSACALFGCANDVKDDRPPVQGKVETTDLPKGAPAPGESRAGATTQTAPGGAGKDEGG